MATVLRSLPEVALRTAFLQDYLGAGEDPQTARVFDELCAAGARAESTAREPVLALVSLLARLADDPILDRLAEHAVALQLRSLSRLLRKPPESAPDSEHQRLPDYGAGRELALGERRALARRPSRRHIDKLLRDPHPWVIAQLLDNPRLTEDDVVRLAALRPGSAQALRALAKTHWLCRPRVRKALIHNPGTPAGIAIPLLGACTRPELTEVRNSAECSAALREIAVELLAMRSLPPPE